MGTLRLSPFFAYAARTVMTCWRKLTSSQVRESSSETRNPVCKAGDHQRRELWATVSQQAGFFVRIQHTHTSIVFACEADLFDWVLGRLPPGHGHGIQMPQEREFAVDRHITLPCVFPLAPVAFQIKRCNLRQPLGPKNGLDRVPGGCMPSHRTRTPICLVIGEVVLCLSTTPRMSCSIQ